MIEANRTLFGRLTNYCSDRDIEIQNPTGARWVHANRAADEVLKDAVVEERVSFGRHRHLARLTLHGVEHLALIGFAQAPDEAGYTLLEDVQGFDVCLLSELEVLPTGSPAEVRNVVEAGSKHDTGYAGHDNETVMRLFPSIQVAEVHGAGPDVSPWARFLALCASETSLAGSWIDQDLTASLLGLAARDVPSLPYRELCRAVFDLDPRSLFMSLYRCIEATYAFERATALATAFGLSLPWHEVAARLDSDMGWRPPELQSLNSTLLHASEDDLRAMCDCLGVTPGADVTASAGRAIYKLRNKIVHYRPSTDPLEIDSVDWNLACNLLVTIAVDVFDHAYGQPTLAHA